MEEKKYSIIGEVRIGTDEYRELIEAKSEQERRADQYMREGWRKDEEIKGLKADVVRYKKLAKAYEKFILDNASKLGPESQIGFQTLIMEQGE